MIIVIVGGIGSGKSLSLVRFIASRKNKVYVNFKVALPNTIRLETDMVVTKIDKKVGVNLDYWRQAKKRMGGGFDVVIDEAKHIMNSRRSMSGLNIAVTSWVGQVRKIFGMTEQHHLVIAEQRLGNVDKAVRDLAHIVVVCKKFVVNDKVFIQQYIFRDDFCVEKAQMFCEGYPAKPSYALQFEGAPYFDLYDSYDFVEFGEERYL